MEILKRWQGGRAQQLLAASESKAKLANNARRKEKLGRACVRACGENQTRSRSESAVHERRHSAVDPRCISRCVACVLSLLHHVVRLPLELTSGGLIGGQPVQCGSHV